MKRVQTYLAVILLLVAAVIFLLGATRIGFLVARSTIGLYEALIIAGIGLVLLITSRRGA
jgi:hypothetical protein